MKNQYPKPCSVCGIRVTPGEGTLEQEGDSWIVTHDNPCPRHPSSRARAQEVAREISRVLETENEALFQLENTVQSLARLMRTGWVVPLVCETKILSCRACSQFDRLTVEELIAVHLHQESTERPV